MAYYTIQYLRQYEEFKTLQQTRMLHTPITEIFNDIPEDVVSIRITEYEAKEDGYLIWPSFRRFALLQSVRLINISSLRKLPEMNNLQFLGIYRCRLEDISSVEKVYQLCLNNNTYLKSHTIPKIVHLLDGINQPLGVFKLPQENIFTYLQECVIDQISDIDQCTTLNIFEMLNCTSPYQRNIDDISTNLGISVFSRCQSDLRILLPHIIDVVINTNRKLLLEFGTTMVGVRNAVMTNTSPTECSSIQTVFVLSSNYPRRMMEYV
jgi:hypothetical protein